MLYCRTCNADLIGGRHPLGNGCSDKRPGRTRQEAIDDARDYQLGSFDPVSSRSDSPHNGAGCYDSDTDFS
jgi:hypothetical protein